MTQTMTKTIQIGNLALCGVLAGWMATATPAKACAGGQAPGAGTTLSGNMAAARMRMTLPPGLTGGTRNGSAPKPDAEAHDVNPPTLAGLWMKTYTLQGQVIDQGFDTFNADGNEMIVDISPPASDNVCTGVWAQTGTFTYTLYHISWTFDMNGNLTGTAVFKETMTLSRDGNSYTGTGTVEFFDNNGNLLETDGPAQITATRIKPL
ncbi:exported hypothetical protein [Candidatus Sulfopaludibacter sp. SbA4]|nr:exported hypothetical protein [Candidatus Sulfopaludibacter sp. SbA4]